MVSQAILFFISLPSIDEFEPLVKAIDRAGSPLQRRIHEPCLDPTWERFVAATLAKQKAYRLLAFLVLFITTVPPAVLFIQHRDPSQLMQTLLFLGFCSSLSAIVAHWVFMATFGLIGGGGSETWGYVLRWRAAVGRTRWRRFWAWHAYTLVREQAIISMGLLIAIMFVVLVEATLKPDSAACGGWHCRKNILVPGTVYLGVTSFRLLLLYTTYDAWFRGVNTTQTWAGPSRSINTTQTNVSPLDPGLDTGLSDSGLDAVPFDSGLHLERMPA